MSKFSNSEISGLVLAGGESRRMKGKDKGLVFFKNNPLIFYSIEILKNKVSNLFCITRRRIVGDPVSRQREFYSPCENTSEKENR